MENDRDALVDFGEKFATAVVKVATCNHCLWPSSVDEANGFFELLDISLSLNFIIAAFIISHLAKEWIGNVLNTNLFVSIEQIAGHFVCGMILVLPSAWELAHLIIYLCQPYRISTLWLNPTQSCLLLGWEEAAVNSWFFE